MSSGSSPSYLFIQYPAPDFSLSCIKSSYNEFCKIKSYIAGASNVNSMHGPCGAASCYIRWYNDVVTDFSRVVRVLSPRAMGKVSDKYQNAVPAGRKGDMKTITCVCACACTVCLELVTGRGGLYGESSALIFGLRSVQNVQNGSVRGINLRGQIIFTPR